MPTVGWSIQGSVRVTGDQQCNSAGDSQPLNGQRDLIEDRHGHGEWFGLRQLIEVFGHVLRCWSCATVGLPSVAEAYEHPGEAAGHCRIDVMGKGARLASQEHD